MRQNDPVVGQILHFGLFPLEKINERGAKKVGNQTSPYLLFKIQDDLVSYRKCCHLVWDEKRLWLGSGGLKCENSVPKFEQESHPDHWGGPIDPKLCGPSSCVHQTWSASIKSYFSTFAPSTPSGIIRYGLYAV